MCLAIPATVLRIEHDSCQGPVAWVDFGGLQRNVNVSCVPDVQVGEYVVVHAGFALAIVTLDDGKELD